MNVLRGIVASIFIFIFTLVAMVVAMGFGFKQTIVPQTTATIIEKARVGERLTAALPDLIIQGLSKPGVSSPLRLEDVQRFVAESLPADQADSMLRSLSGEVVSYIRGDADTISKVDLAPTEARAVAAAKKIIPGKVGAQLAAAIQQQFKSAGWDKGLAIPTQQLDAARNAFSQFRLGAGVALALALLVLLLVFAVAPHGLRGRLRWCSVALIIAGCLSASVALMAWIAPGMMPASSLGPNVPPAIQNLIKDMMGALGGVLAFKIFIVAAVYIVSGVALIVIRSILRKRGVSSASASTVKK